MLSLKLVEAFYWVARLRGFHAAADRLRVAQPSITYRVKELERQLGRTLLIRGSRPVRLTSQGQALFDHAERLVATVHDMQRQFRPGSPVAGAMRLGVTDAFAAVCLPALLHALAAEHPQLDVSVAVDHSYVLTMKLDAGELDAAVVSTPPNLPGLRYELLGHQRVSWVGAGSGAGPLPRDAAALADARIFATPAPSNLSRIVTDWFRAAGVSSPRLSLCNSMSAILGLVESGIGFGVLPMPMIGHAIAAGRLRTLELPVTLPPQAVYAAFAIGMLDTALPVTVNAIRTVARDRSFCG